jgi:hypothetical protein
MSSSRVVCNSKVLFQERGWEEKENGGEVNSTMIYLIYSKNFCKCHNVPPPSTIKNEIL